MRRYLSCLCLLLVPTVAVTATTGRICLAPFADQSLTEPLLLPRSGAASRYAFWMNGRLLAEVGVGESARIDGLPLAQELEVQVRLNGRATETLALRLQAAPDDRICLRLATGYANWRIVDSGAGCDC